DGNAAGSDSPDGTRVPALRTGFLMPFLTALLTAFLTAFLTLLPYPSRPVIQKHHSGRRFHCPAGRTARDRKLRGARTLTGSSPHLRAGCTPMAAFARSS